MLASWWVHLLLESGHNATPPPLIQRTRISTGFSNIIKATTFLPHFKNFELKSLCKVCGLLLMSASFLRWASVATLCRNEPRKWETTVFAGFYVARVSVPLSLSPLSLPRWPALPYLANVFQTTHGHSNQGCHN